MSNLRKSINLLVAEGTITPYTFILSTANHTHLGQIICIDDNSTNVELHSNQAHKITFNTFKYYQNDEGELIEQPLWDKIEPLKYMYCLELDEYFVIDVELNDEHNEIKISKSITATSQCEVELSQKKIYDLEINTEKDYMIADTKNLYYTTYFYKSGYPDLSLLHRVLTFAPAYSIGTIDDTLLKAFATDVRTFSVNGTTVYDFLTSDVAKEFHCMFEFDTVNRIINVHDLYSTCKTCGYYGEFQTQCPKCKGTDIQSYGYDTCILVSTQNLSDQVKFTTNTDSIKNCFRLTAGDDLMNVAIREINPTGSNYIFNLPQNARKDFSDQLKSKLSLYDSVYLDTIANTPIGIDASKINSYNNVVRKYKSNYKEYYKNSFGESVKIIEEINSNSKGTDPISMYYSQTLEFENFLQSAMLPTVTTGNVNSSGEKTRLETAINNGKFNNIGIPDSTATKTTLENAVKNYTKLYVRSGYMHIEITTNSFDVNTLTWNGYITIKSYSDENDISKSKAFNASFTKDYSKYLTQKAEKDIADSCKKDNSYFDVFSIDSDSEFAKALTLYNKESLLNIYKAYESALTVLITSDNSGLKSIKEKYQNRLNSTSNEIAIRENECNIVSDIYSSLLDRLNDIHNTLSLRNFIGATLYDKELSLYVREEEYSNTNFISSSLTNPMVADQAKKFLEAATKELIKASTPQHTISTSIKNLALIPEFEPYITDFALNNWIRVECDGMIYRLRLIGFTINFGSLSDISVEFSDITAAPGFISDMQSLLQQASSMATSYDYTTRQAEKGYEGNVTIGNWMKAGINSAEIVLRNNDNEEVVTDRNGITAKIYDDINEKYDPHQIRLTHNMLAFTDDAWKPGSVKSAFGEHNYKYWNGTEFVTGTSYGLTSEFVTSAIVYGGQIIGSEIYSSNWNGSNRGTYIDLENNIINLGDKLSFSNETLTFGDSVALKWGNLPSNVASTGYVDSVALQAANNAVGSINYTQITKDYVLTPELYANNLHIQAANISGKLTASQIETDNLYVKSANISGKLTASQIEADNLHIQAANIDGDIDCGKLKGGTITGQTITGASGEFTQGFSVDIKQTNTGSFKIYADGQNIFIGWDDEEDSQMDSYIKISPGSISLCARSVHVDGQLVY